MSSPQAKPWDVESLEADQVWEGRPAIYEQVRQAAEGLDAEAPLTEISLSDDEQHRKGGLRWAAGALDGVMGHHAQADDERLRAKQIVKALRDLLAESSPANLAHLTRLLVRAPVLGVLDDVLSELVSGGELDPDRFHELALLLVQRAPDREIVKVGISMIGVLVGCDERETLLTIGRHEEFTLYAAVAIAGTVDDPEHALWQLARSVRGWGRIHAVERLADTVDPEIRGWMLREGYHNEIMDEYLAHTCAVSGDLVGALEADIVDDALLDGAAGLFAAMLNGGPAEDIEDYQQAPQAAEAYLRHLSRRPAHRSLDLRHLLVAEQLREFIGPVGDDLEEDETLRELGWTLEIRSSVLDMCAQTAERSEWRPQVLEGLEAEDPGRFHQADAAAQLLGIDAWPHHLHRVEADPCRSPSWFRLVQTEDPERFETVLSLAMANLPLEEIATGPAEETGLGPEFDVHDTLLVVVHALVDKPGRGVELIAAALRSPVTRVRRGALRVLSAWGDSLEQVSELLERAAEEEPDEELAADIGKVLAEARA
ncbi:hypothetical protein G6O69_24605 [Pseudenhygromyxa sp. WMMC2535]|uniref:hypothetical protein n=1 Tax=Pseudenhygromyxa sp. WMMC2535 TaxID=2712867 RepID=UPI00155328D4|nr:hypothetical protein [Pseudenhygromyxa sp. WMMC2535]NVB41045.1 hypothetical protein [Pseudenhygromyxa sp. WMMC2535]